MYNKLMTKWVTIGTPIEIANEECKILEIDHTPIAIFNLDGEFCAIQDNCPHQHLPIADGVIDDGTITCPYHNAKFDLKTGAVLAPPACENLTTYPTRIVNGEIQVQLD